jgi:hypothetical protein
MGLDLPAIRGRVGLAAAVGGGAAGRFTRGFSPGDRLAWSAAAAGVGAGVTWFLLRRRYAALAAIEELAASPSGPGDDALRDRLVAAFFRHDPVDLLLDDRNPADYAPEVRRLMAALPGLRNEGQVRSAIYTDLLEAFESVPQPSDPSLEALAAEVWTVWSSRHRDQTPAG